MFVVFGLSIGVIVTIPLLLSIFQDSQTLMEKLSAAAVLGVAFTAICSLIGYLVLPALYSPLWGGAAFGFTAIGLIIATIIAGMIDDRFPFPGATVVVLAIVFAIVSGVFLSSEMFNAAEYAKLIGPVKTKVWTQDIQPKDPHHIRTNSEANALYMAKAAVSQAGAIGNQFQIDEEHITLQKIGNRFWFIVPLDHVGWATWRHTKKVPAYIRVSGEDPSLPAELVKFPEGQEPVYTPGSFWSSDLERHLWTHGYANIGVIDYTPEIDESGKFWYVATTFEYAVNGWDGMKVTGVAIVDPVTGQIQQYPLGKVPEWADRVIPKEVVKQNLTYRGLYPEGDYWNKVSFLGIGARKNMTKPEDSNMVFGENGDLQWVTGVTSTNGKDMALVGLYYVDTHTGETVFYQAQGATDSAIVSAIDKHPDVQYRKLSGVAPQIYNILGTMTAIVPMMNENHAYQGMGFVNVKNLQVVSFGTNQIEAYERYEAALGQSGHQLSPELTRQMVRTVGTVDRFFAETQSGGATMFYLHISGVPHLFSGNSMLSPKLRMVHEGDKVQIAYVISGQDVEPLREFDNLSLPLEATASQERVRMEGRADVVQASRKESAQTVREQLKSLSDEELLKRLGENGKK